MLWLARPVRCLTFLVTCIPLKQTQGTKKSSQEPKMQQVNFLKSVIGEIQTFAFHFKTRRKFQGSLGLKRAIHQGVYAVF